jgi:rhodanese-related sulfurtransferase
VDYGSGIIFTEKIPNDDWKKFLIIDTRDPGQFAKNHIPRAINIEWRQVLAKRTSIQKDRPLIDLLQQRITICAGRFRHAGGRMGQPAHLARWL